MKVHPLLLSTQLFAPALAYTISRSLIGARHDVIRHSALGSLLSARTRATH